MKNLFFALAFMLVGTLAFANNSVEDKEVQKDETTISVSETKSENLTLLVENYFDHTCKYKIVNSQGETVGGVILEGVPDNVSCDSDEAKRQALQIFQNAEQ